MRPRSRRGGQARGRPVAGGRKGLKDLTDDLTSSLDLTNQVRASAEVATALTSDSPAGDRHGQTAMSR